MKKNMIIVVYVLLILILFSLIFLLVFDTFGIPIKEGIDESSKKYRVNNSKEKKLNRKMNAKGYCKKKNKPKVKSRSREELLKKLKERIKLLKEGKGEFEVKNEKKFYGLIEKLKKIKVFLLKGIDETKKGVEYLKRLGFLVGMSRYFARIVMKMLRERLFSGRFKFYKLDDYLVLSLGFSSDPNVIKFLKELYSYRQNDVDEYDWMVGRLRYKVLSAIVHPKYYASMKSIEDAYKGDDILFNRVRIGEIRWTSKIHKEPSDLLDFLPYRRISSEDMKDFFISIIKNRREFADIRVRAIFFLKQSLVADNFQVIGDIFVQLAKDETTHNLVRSAAGYALKKRLDYYYKDIKDILLDKKIPSDVRQNVLFVIPASGHSKYDRDDPRSREFMNLFMYIAKDKENDLRVRRTAIQQLDTYLMFPEAVNLLLDFLNNRVDSWKEVELREIAAGSLATGLHILKDLCKERYHAVCEAFSSVLKWELDKKKYRNWKLLKYTTRAIGKCGNMNDIPNRRKLIRLKKNEGAKDSHYLIKWAKESIKKIEKRER